MFLTKEEIKALTGRSYPKYQRQWFKRHSIPFVESATGIPIVSKSLIENMLGATNNNIRQSAQPNEEGLKILMKQKKKK